METGLSHPDAFNVCGPRNVHSLRWKDIIIRSIWKDGNYKRSVIACFIQAVYLLELDRQENRTNENALAPKWWTPFKYKLVETLTDDRDGSIFGAILEWDRAACFVPMRPSGAPRALLALRGTLLKSPTIRRDIEDDLRFLAMESLKGSVRFSRGLKALRSISDKYGSSNVCVAGHSLGAGFALQIWKELAKQGVYVESHLFNPPSVSLKAVGEKAGLVWDRVRAMVPYLNGGTSIDERSKSAMALGPKKWVVPHLYINDSDYVCCYYTDHPGGSETRAVAKLLVYAKGNKQKFVEAHGLEQWWSDDLELRMALDNSKLISRQLKSLYSLSSLPDSSRKV